MNSKKKVREIEIDEVEFVIILVLETLRDVSVCI